MSCPAFFAICPAAYHRTSLRAQDRVNVTCDVMRSVAAAGQRALLQRMCFLFLLKSDGISNARHRLHCHHLARVGLILHIALGSAHNSRPRRRIIHPYAVRSSQQTRHCAAPMAENYYGVA